MLADRLIHWPPRVREHVPQQEQQDAHRNCVQQRAFGRSLRRQTTYAWALIITEIEFVHVKTIYRRRRALALPLADGTSITTREELGRREEFSDHVTER